MSYRFVVRGKVYYLQDLDMQRVAAKKSQKYLVRLPEDKRHAFETILGAISEALKWEELNAHVERAILQGKPQLIRGNIYDLQEQINTILRRVDRWVRRNQTFTQDKMREFVVAIYKSARSICRIFDRTATCWENESSRIVIAYVSR